MLPSLIDRLGDAKDQVRDQDQSLLLKIMEQAASPQVSRSHMLEIRQRKHPVCCVLLQYLWDRMLGCFKHKNSRTREGLCLCLIATLDTWVQPQVLIWRLTTLLSFVPDDWYFTCPMSVWPSSCSPSRYGAQGLTLSKILPHLCYLLGDPVSQVCLIFQWTLNLQILWHTVFFGL